MQTFHQMGPTEQLCVHSGEDVAQSDDWGCDGPPKDLDASRPRSSSSHEL